MMQPDDDLDAALAKIRSGSTAPAGDDLDAALASIRKSKTHAPPTGHNGVPFVDAKPGEDDGPGYRERLATTILEGAQVIPGMKALEAGAGAVGSRAYRLFDKSQPKLSYRDAYRGMEDQTSQMGGTRKFLAQAASSPVLAPILAARGVSALSTAKQGALLGGADQLLSGDPDATAKGTVIRTALGAGAGGAMGKLGSALVTGVRGAFAKSTGQQAITRAEEIAAADKAAYGPALDQGKDYLRYFDTPAKVQQAFNTPGIKKYVDLVRKSPAFEHADDATLLAEAYKQMTAQQGGIAQRARDVGYDAAEDLENKGIQLSKRKLTDAADQMMPDFRPAVAQHAKAKAKQEVAAVIDAGAGRLARGTKVSIRNADRPGKSPEALAKFIKTLNPDDAKIAREALLGQVQQNSGIVRNTVTGKNNLNVLGPANRVAPFLRQLDEQAGQGPLMQALRAMGLGTAGAPFR